MRRFFVQTTATSRRLLPALPMLAMLGCGLGMDPTDPSAPVPGFPGFRPPITEGEPIVTGIPPLCTEAECGPRPLPAQRLCPDGTTVTPDITCEPQASGACGWTITSVPCPSDPTCADGQLLCPLCPGSGFFCSPADQPCPIPVCPPPPPDENPCIDITGIFCAALPPECPPGLVNSARGGCWGPCVDPVTCQPPPPPPSDSPCVVVTPGVSLCGGPAPECPPGLVNSSDGPCWGPCVDPITCEPPPPPPVDCDPKGVLCKALPPFCPPGSVPSVRNRCWGPCVPIAECAPIACSADIECPAGSTCTAGTCSAPTPSGADCDPKRVLCDVPPPLCAPGFVPSVRSNCWGPCVPYTECAPIECRSQGDCPPNLACWGTTGTCGPYVR